jgi:ankyrin repeat protein
VPASPRSRGLSRRKRPRFGVFLFVLLSSTLVVAGEIHDAVNNNDLAEVRRLISANPTLVFSKDEDGFTPLHLAASDGYKEIAELLLASNANVNARDNHLSTPLHQVAASGGHADLMELLIDHKADVNAVDENGLTPLHYATLTDNVVGVKILLIHGAHPDVRDAIEGNTALTIAVAEGFQDVVETLLANGANVNAPDKTGTPLAWAIHTGHSDIANLLRQRGGHE